MRQIAFSAKKSSNEKDTSYYKNKKKALAAFSLITALSFSYLPIASAKISVGKNNTQTGAVLGEETGSDDTTMTVYGKANNTTVNNGGDMTLSGGDANYTTVNSGGNMTLHSSADAEYTTINGGNMTVNGGSADYTTINDGGVMDVGNLSFARYTTINNGGVQYVNTGAIRVLDTTINNGGKQIVGLGQTNFTTIKSGGWQEVLTGGKALNTYLEGGGVQYLNGGISVDTTVYAGGHQIVGMNASSQSTVVKSGGIVSLYAGSSFSSSGIEQGAEFRIYAGGSRTSRYIGTLDLTGSKMNFYLNDVAANDVLLNVTGSVNLSSTSQIGIFSNKDLALNVNDEVILVDKTTGTFSGDYTVNATGTGSLVYDFEVRQDSGPDHSLIATLMNLNRSLTSERGKAYSEGKLAGVNHLLLSTDLITGSALDDAWQQAPGRNTFFSFGGGKIRAHTGSHIDSNAFALATGTSFKQENEKYSSTLAPFFEGGWGNYSTYNLFSTGAVTGDGETKHYGLGLMAKRQNTDGFYYEGSLRAGRVETDFKSSDMGTGADFDSKSMYLGAHFGLGKINKLRQDAHLDTYMKFLYTGQGSDSIITGAGEDIRFQAVNSMRIRLGTRYIKEVSENTNYHLGLAFEHEFSGRQKASLNGIALDIPELKGSSAVIELGVKHKLSDKWTVDLLAMGTIGKRDGVSGNLSFNYNF